MNQLGDSKLYSTFDCADFFFQNRLRYEDSWKTAISTCFQKFEWRVCPQGLASSPGVAQRLFSGILQSLPCVHSDLTKHPTERRNMLAGNATVFLDDALTHGGDFDEHLAFVYSFLLQWKSMNYTSRPRQRSSCGLNATTWGTYCPQKELLSSPSESLLSKSGQCPSQQQTCGHSLVSAYICDVTSKVSGSTRPLCRL